MTGAGGAVITPRMLDVLSSGGVTNGQALALAQGPYLKIRWAVGSPEDDGIGEGRRLDEKSYCNGVNQGICDTFTEGITMRSTVQGDRTGLPSTPGVFHSVESRWAKFGGSSRPLNACEKKADAIDFQRKSQRNEIFQ
ncbi:hypothetical protein THAOC_28028, partial [Thalassiosira oceanica]